MTQLFDAIIIGGSYSGLAAGMALGRALKQVLIIDSGKPCNAQTPHSHNFLTQDGSTPAEISAIAKQQVGKYPTITFLNGIAIKTTKNQNGFEIQVASGETYWAKQLIFATGIRDILPDIAGISECWGISVLHCPFCHGYEMRNEKTGIIGNGDAGYELAGLIANWTQDLTLFTNGASTLTAEQTAKLNVHQIKIVETGIERLEHTNGYLQHIILKDGTKAPVTAVYVRSPCTQACQLPESLGCTLTEDGYIKVDAFQETTIKGVFACGDNTTKTRTVANAVAMGTTAGMTVSKQLISAEF
ncbi:MAG: NAD(P)/FAD-dependent oxidoreductase [Bacteroidota bacterium]